MTRTYAPRMTPELRKELIERVRDLNGQGLFDTEISTILGYSQATIRNLRYSAGIRAVAALKSADRETRALVAATEELDCPTCQMPVEVVHGFVNPHKGFLGRVGPGAIHGSPVQIAQDCPAGGQPYHLVAANDTVRSH